jgi:2,4-dienoyl-CoA reductase-like NADH-dependent reductase (Old Yellow Enzyme family)
MLCTEAPGYITEETIGPSAAAAGTIPAGSRRQAELPARVRAATAAELDALVAKFAHAAGVLAACGWDGVQPHAAHAYFVSSFLSPATNQRTDEYGGSLANRARLLLRIVDAIREAVPAAFLLSVKIHCSDFMADGLTVAEAAVVCGWLADKGVELIELSGNIGAVLRAEASGESLADAVALALGGGVIHSDALLVSIFCIENHE